MSKQFNIGDEVSFLNEAGKGIVREVKADGTIMVEDDTGFENPYPPSELVPASTHEDYELDSSEADREIERKARIQDTEEADRKLRQKFKHLDKMREPEAKWEIDLHIEELIDTHRGMDNHQILTIQMTRFRHFLERAFDRKIHKVIAIHGKGEGVLRDEIRIYLSKFENIEFFDAPYTEYGQGATEIRVRYN